MVKRRIKMVCGAIALYICSYIVLSITGGYEISKSGKFTQFSLPLPVHDILIWQLHYGRDSPFHDKHSAFSILYAPLLWADRSFWHQELPMLRQDVDGNIVECPPPPRNKLHPRMRRVHDVMMSYNERLKLAEATPSKEDDAELNKKLIEELKKIYK